MSNINLRFNILLQSQEDSVRGGGRRQPLQASLIVKFGEEFDQKGEQSLRNTIVLTISSQDYLFPHRQDQTE